MNNVDPALELRCVQMAAQIGLTFRFDRTDYDPTYYYGFDFAGSIWAPGDGRSINEARDIPNRCGRMQRTLPAHHNRLVLLTRDYVYHKLGLSWSQGEQLRARLVADPDMRGVWVALQEAPNDLAPLMPLLDWCEEQGVALGEKVARG